MNKTITAALVVLSVIFLAGCYQQSNAGTPAATSPGTALGVKADVQIKDFAYNPATLTITAGTTVIWTNYDSAPHTVTSDSGNELDSGTLSQGQSYTHTFETAGTYSYYCTIHPSMKGKVVVEESSMPERAE